MAEIYYIHAKNRSIGRVFCFSLENSYRKYLKQQFALQISSNTINDVINSIDLVFNVLVVANNDQLRDQIDKLLWTYSKQQFIPHATCSDSYLENQPICISSRLYNYNNTKSVVFFSPSKAKILNTITDIKMQNLEHLQKIIYLYDNNHEVGYSQFQELINKSHMHGMKIHYMEQ